MKIYYHRNFEKQLVKLREAERKKFLERSSLFVRQPFHPVLNNHELSGKYRGYRSINIGGDLRVLYEPIGSDVVLFVTIDPHSNLYK
ncbi:MAG: type II toxin-antitoxin system mRNA interferase toxin, RelE/StbE family [bacterium]|nr:type II toxin-antitoxin system mRNA interferase toxin, RelE/StbE family [bacterium]